MLSLIVLKGFCDWLLSALEKLPAWAWLALVLTLWGGLQLHRVNELTAATQKAAITAAQAVTYASEAARAKEQHLSTINQGISDALSKATIELNGARAAVSDRLQRLAHAKPANQRAADALTACRSNDSPAAAILPDATRDALVDLARDADQVSNQLTACQAYLKDAEGEK